MSELEKLKSQGEAPKWYTEESFATVSKGYMLPSETPKSMYRRVVRSACKSGNFSDDIKDDLFHVMYHKNWLGPASPVLSNLGTDRALPISCFTIDVDDKMEDIIGRGTGELGMLTKLGGGVGVSMQRLRPRGSLIKGGKNGVSEGMVPFAKVYDSVIMASKQGEVRRGSASINLSIEHGDWGEFVRMRRPEGDVNRQCLNLHHCATISDEFMHKVINGDTESRLKWTELMKTRIETGEPYIMYADTVNRNSPKAYKDKGLKVSATNICCLTGETLVATSRGPKRIDQLVGKSVEVFDGESWVECSNFELKGHTSDIYEITFKDGEKVKATGNHRWFISESYEDIRSNRLKEVLTKDLQAGTFCEYHLESTHGSTSLDSAYLKGFLIGDGTACNKGLPRLALHSTKYICEDKLIDSLRETPVDKGIRSDCITKPSFNSEKSYTGTKAWGNQSLKYMRGLTARKSKIIKWATEYKKGFDFTKFDKKSKLSLLSGLLDSDGTYGNSIQYSSTSEKLIRSIKGLINSLGYSASIDVMSKDNENYKDVYRLTIGSYDSYILIQELECARLKFKGDKAPNRRTTGYRAIKSIIKLDSEEVPVYCPSISSTSRFALANGLMTGNSEITLHTDPLHSFVCCLSSLNLAEYDNWKDWKGEKSGMSLPELSTYFLNGVLDEFIDKAQYLPYMENAVRSAVKGRALGLGVMGWHTYLLDKNIPFESFQAMQLNNEVFSFIHSEATKASKDLALERYEPEWCEGTGMYNSHLIAIAPTKSNSIICGDVSAGIEPITANAYTDVTGKGSFMRKSKHLVKLLQEKGEDTPKVWKSISNNKGSVQHLEFLTDEEKEVFKTAYEINQKALVQQASQRQKYVCQSQSLNLFFPFDVDPKYFNDVHILAWELGVKTLYYCKSTKGIEVIHRDDDCKSCEG